MFSALESTWDQSARRGWTTLASFTMQAFGLSLLLAIPLFWVERPPRLEWLQPLASPAAFTPAPETQARGRHTETAAATNPRTEQITAPPSIPDHVATNDNAPSVPSAPELPIGIGPGHGPPDGVRHRIGDAIPIVTPPHPPAAKPLVVSDLGEGSLLRRVQPAYPPIARLARVQGAVQLRAIISKAGTIENLVVVSGPPTLVKSAIDAVRQWRYRPYLLNGEPIEVETEITINFVLSQN